MASASPEGGGEPSMNAVEAGPRGPGLATLIGVLVLYSACLIAATFPMITTFATHLPAATVADPVIHLWTMRWYTSCLLEGRMPFLCPDIQAPVGAPLGYLPPMQLQTLIYLPLSAAVANDVLAYNLIWFSEFLLAGFGTFALAWYLLRDRWCATVAGLLAMLCGPVRFSGQGELEQLAIGLFPIFLVCWMRFVDRPGRGRLAGAVGSYLVLATGAPYFGIMAIVPAVVYVLARALGDGRRGAWPWLRGRGAWLVGFGAIVGLAAPVLFAPQVWAMLHGYPMARPDSEFKRYGTSIWNYLFPPSTHVLWQVLPEFHQVPSIAGRVPNYLGVVMLGLLAYAAAARVRFRHSGYLWASLGILVVLSLGAYWTVGAQQIPLPALWLRRWGLVFGPIRVPSRFALLAAICASVIAGAALRHLMQQRAGWRRAALAVVLPAVAVLDMASLPFPTSALPPMPDCYAFLRDRDPDATFYEVHPFVDWGDYLGYQAILPYWQALHGGRTSAGYTACWNHRYEDLVNAVSPFSPTRLDDPHYLARPEDASIDLARHVRFDDYAWLYLDTHQFDYLILHTWNWRDLPPAPAIGRIKDRYGHAAVFEDDRTLVLDRRRLAPPAHPVVLCTDGWRARMFRHDRIACPVARVARLSAYNPDAGQPLRLALEAASYQGPTTVRLLHEGRELARWTVEPRQPQTLISPSFRLPAGRSELTLESDRDAAPAKLAHAPIEGDLSPFSLWASALVLQADSPLPQQASSPGAERR